jgi:hypothetical protein
VNYEEAFEALKNGDFHTAVPLLEKAARETGYNSEVINHAYTLALYRKGDKERLAEVSFRVGNALVAEDPASAMDYFQRAMFGGLEQDRVRRIGEIFEQWAAPRVHPALDGPVTRVAHVVGCVLPGHAPTQYVKMLVSSLKKQGIESTVYTTEWAASWFFNPTGDPQSQALNLEADVKIAAVDGDFLQRAEKIADAIRGSGVQVAFFHGSLNEQITGRVAAMRPARVQINVNHGTEMDADVFNGRIHLFQNAMQRTRFANDPAEWIPLASDVEARMEISEPVTRQAMGLESATTISATFGNMYKVAGSGYARVLSEIMKRFPKHFHLFAGAGNVRGVRSHLHSEGVLPRVRFLGHVSDVAPILDVIDVYFASFPHSGGHSILEAMGAGKPVVALRFPPDSHYNSGAELVGIRELIAPGEADYIEIADRLLRNPTFRGQQSQLIRDRFRAQFRPERLGERYRAFLALFESS